MKALARGVLALYVVILLWLVLFKFSTDIFAVLSGHQSRSLNLVPFSGSSPREMLDNFLAFLPLGVLLGIDRTSPGFWRKGALIALLSLAAEGLQYALAIGATDITDVVMNTSGGFVGLGLIELSHAYIRSERLLRVIDLLAISIIAALLVVFLLLRIFVFQVRY